MSPLPDERLQPDWITQLERLAESHGGFVYPWRSTLPSENGETAYTALVERHLALDLFTASTERVC